jgi:type VI protein secretion system component VasK
VAWWISGGLIVLGVVLLALVVSLVVGRLRPLRRALRRLQARAAETEELQANMAALQDRALSLQVQLETTQERTDRRRDGREVSAPAEPT